ncbi:hypothetical protein FDECE_10993 [Fusarium decemcellulare]|nr:hypothetical protein FDECE_10993 [Fusarium decemcellulare]
MVSFFGLKLGGDRKKSQDKSKPSPKNIQHLHRVEQEDFTPPRDIQDLKDLRRLSNFSRPNLVRPDTSSSNRDLSTQWRAPYMNGAGGASSMVDLGAPRAPGMGNPRFHASDVNLNTRFANSSSTSLVAPGPIGGGASANRPGTPTRPGTAASRKEFDNPFNVHFGKDSVSSIPGTPLDSDNRSTFEQFEFGLKDDNSRDIKDVTTNSATNGYPSPPPSIVNAERPFSPTSQISLDNRPSSSRRNVPAPSGLRTVDVAGPMALPSPAASIARSSEDIWEIPVIRNVQAKRDTMTFHTPRRQSFAMEVKEVRTREGTKPMVEGFAGNFAGFDFGESVRRGSVSSGSRNLETPTPTSEGAVSPTDTTVKPRAFGTARTASPLRAMHSSPSLSDTGLTRTRTASDATSPLSAVSTAEDTPRIQTPQPPQEAQPAKPTQQLQTPKVLQPGQLSQPLQLTRPISPSRSPMPSPLSQPPQLQQDSPTFPTFQKHTPQSSQLSSQYPYQFSEQSSLLPPTPQQPLKQYIPYQPPDSSPPNRPLPTPYRSPTAPLPQLPIQATSRSNTAPASAAGAHPGYMSRPLDPPPRSRARGDSDARSIASLRAPPSLADRSAALPNVGGGTRSPYGPAVDEGNYMRSESSPRKAPEPPRAESPFSIRALEPPRTQSPMSLRSLEGPRTQSPLSMRTPIEGDFPVSRGLPRGRKPPGMDQPTSPEAAFGLEPRKQRRQRPMYPPPRSVTTPTPEPQHKDSFDSPGGALPNWADFDRADAHRSAMPPPLSPFRANFPLQSPSQATDESGSPRFAQYTSSPISPTAPSLPSPSFPSLQQSISNSNENLARSFDMAADGAYEQPPEPPNYNRPLISPVMVDFVPPRTRDHSATRVEAKRAPPRPRPGPITVPSGLGVGPESARVRTPNPVVDANNPGFI